MSSADGLVRRALVDFVPYRSGTSVDEVKRRFGIDRPVKLSQNENPLGTSPKALAALQTVPEYNEYVEDGYRALRERLAQPYGLSADHVICGHGSNELIAIAFLAFVDPGEEVVMAQPTFGLFRKDAQIAGAQPVEIPLRDGVHDLDGMLAAVTARTKMVFVCDPNNPTGTRVERDALHDFAAALPDGVLLVVDQAYREYMNEGACDAVELLARRPQTLVLRTASKIFGLASIRFGYGYSSPEVITWMDRVRVPFNVARPAMVAVLAALGDAEFLARSRAVNETGKGYLYREFARLGLPAFQTAANFVTVAVPTGADRAYEALLERGIIVRSGDGLGLPGHLRVSIGTPEQNAAFIAALDPLVAQWRALPGRIA